jgi:Fe-S-cluster containining protein
MAVTRRPRALQALFPIVDELVDSAVHEFRKTGGAISCKKGCNHCCHLLIEISWEEAVELAIWLSRQTPSYQKSFLTRLAANVDAAREFFRSRRSRRARNFAEVVQGPNELPDSTYDDYFYKSAPRPCPFLVNGICSAYEARPTPCRLHLVSTDPKFCSAEEPDPAEYDVPQELESVKEDLGPVISALERDGRWGHFGIVLQEVLIDMANNNTLPVSLQKSIQHSPVCPQK